jgi:hypothetical protein
MSVLKTQFESGAMLRHSPRSMTKFRNALKQEKENEDLSE